MPGSRLAGALAVVLLAAGCAGGSGDAPEPVLYDTPSPTVTPSPSATSAAAPDLATLFPLTGTGATNPATRTRPVVAAVVRFGPGAATVGLDGADIVYQEPARGAESRLVALYQSQDAARIGPIGNTQPSDAGLLSLVKPIYAYGGGADRLVTRLAGTGLVQVTPAKAAGAFPGGYTSTTGLRQIAGARAGRPLQLLLYGDPGQPLAGGSPAKVSSVTVTVPGQPAQVWTRDATGGWVQSGAGAPRIRVANLLIPQTVYRELRSDKAGNTVREANVFGKGSLTAISGDLLVKGTWVRPGPDATTNYIDTTGVPLRLAAGRTWVLLAPAGTSVVQR